MILYNSLFKLKNLQIFFYSAFFVLLCYSSSTHQELSNGINNILRKDSVISKKLLAIKLDFLKHNETLTKAENGKLENGFPAPTINRSYKEKKRTKRRQFRVSFIQNIFCKFFFKKINV